MKTEKYLTSKEFQECCGITKNALVWYEKKGLVKPEAIGENGYHYYSRRQYFEVDIIKTLKGTGKSLSECEDYISNRSEEAFYDLLIEQQKDLAEQQAAIEFKRKIVEWSLQDYLMMRAAYTERPVLTTIHDVHLLTEKIHTYTPKEHLSALNELFSQCYHLGRTYGGVPSMLNSRVLSRQALEDREFQGVTHVCLKLNKAMPVPECRTVKKGAAVICFHKGTPKDLPYTYEAMLDFIRRNGLTIRSDALEFDYVNYLATGDERDYKIEIVIPVEEKA